VQSGKEVSVACKPGHGCAQHKHSTHQEQQPSQRCVSAKLCTLCYKLKRARPGNLHRCRCLRGALGEERYAIKHRGGAEAASAD